jgi:hypothetical protein
MPTEPMKHKTLYIAIIVFVFVQSLEAIVVINWTYRSPTDRKWRISFNEPASTELEWQNSFNENKEHERIMQFQHRLGVAKDLDKLSRELEVQLRIEELIIKSREAEYAKITPFSPNISTLISGILGLIGGWLVQRRGRSSASATW